MNLASAVFNDEMRALRARFESDFAEWKRVTEGVVADRLSGKQDDNYAARHARSNALFGAVRKHIDQLQDLVENEITTLREQAATSRAQVVADMNENSREATLVSLALGGGALGVTLLLAAFICVSVFRRLGNLLQRMTDVAEGAATSPSTSTTRRRTSAACSPSSSTPSSARSGDHKSVAVSSQSVASTATEIAVNERCRGADHPVRADSRSPGHTAAETASQCRASAGGQVVSQTVEQIEQIADGAELGRQGRTRSQATRSARSSRSSTTSPVRLLLASNAAIEARAGEHGRGFAVVADEVRKLAERTTQATEQVGQSIRQIQQETSSAVTNMQAGRDKVQHGVEYARKAGDALSAIVAAAEQQSGVTIEIAQSIEHLNSVASQSREGAQQAAAAATQLSSEAEKLQSLVNRFKV